MSSLSEDEVAPDSDTLVRVPVSTVTAVAIGAVVLVNIANVAGVALRPWEGGRFYGTARWVLLTSENNVATWLSTSLWLGAAVTALAMSSLVEPEVRNRWRELSAILLLLSIDEAASVHEKVPEWLEIDRGTIVTYSWVLPVLVIVILIAARLAPFVLRLDPPTRSTVIGGFGLLLLGAMVIETFGGEWDEANGVDNVGYQLISGVEENLEFAAAIVMFVGLLAAIRRHRSRFTVAID